MDLAVDASRDKIDLALASIPRYRLLEGWTRLQRLTRVEAKIGGSPALYAKRDDAMGIGIGGNKLRSLEFWLGEAMAQGADTLLVAGGPASNQCRLTAAAASIAGLGCHVFHNADPTRENRDASFLNRVFGADVRFIGGMDENQRAEMVSDAANELRRSGARPYIVGDAALGALGYVVAAQELHRQNQEAAAGIRHVFLPGSMGPTEAGFILGNQLLGSPFAVHLVSVEYGQAELAARVERILRDASALLGSKLEADVVGSVHYHMDHLGPGYAAPTPAGEKALLTLAQAEGILLEHVYTAKTFAGMLDCIAERQLPSDEAAVFIHTGGVPALFTQIGCFESI